MKFIIILILFILFSSTIASCQISLGIYGNPTIDVSNADRIHYNNYSAGLKAKLKLWERLSYKLGLAYEYNYYDVSGMIRPASLDPYADFITLHLLKHECHLRIDFLKSTRRISLYTFFGPTLNSTLREKTDFGKHYGAIDSKKIRVYNLLATFGIGAGFRIYKSLVLELEPACTGELWANYRTPSHGFIATPRYGLCLSLNYKFQN